MTSLHTNDGCNVLMIAPRFGGMSFWNYRATCELAGARYPQPPLGLITVAGMLPRTWSVRLVDRNIEEVTPDDFAWADLIMTGGMLPQQHDMLAIIDQTHGYNKPCAVGGADATSSPHIYASADFRVLGEAEGGVQVRKKKAKKKSPIRSSTAVHYSQGNRETPAPAPPI